MAIKRTSVENIDETIVEIIESSFVDNMLVFDDKTKLLFENYIKRTEECFFAKILAYTFSEKSVFVMIEYSARNQTSVEIILKKFKTWIYEYSPWLSSTKSFEEYLNKNAFNQSFIKGNFLQCFARMFNRVTGREFKLLQNHKSIVLENSLDTYKELLLRFAPAFFNHSVIDLDELTREEQVDAIYNCCKEHGMKKYENLLDRYKSMIVFVINYLRVTNCDSYLKHEEQSTSINTSLKKLIKGRIIACRETISMVIGKKRCYQVRPGINLFTLRPI